jgi:two-component system chemotaxis response regulator CheB
LAGHDILVIGGSAGSVESLREIVRRLPASLPAAVFIVIHTTPYSKSYLPQLLARAGLLPASHPRDREKIEPGRIYIAPPDYHLLVGDGFVRVVQGPREHSTRPAIDPLFRTAALSYGPRVVGTILSGGLDDGTLGLRAIKARAGSAIVLDPKEALVPDMPANALRRVTVDYRLPVTQIAPTLVRLAHEPADGKGAPPVSKELAFEAAMAAWDLDALEGHDRPGRPSPFSCPDCGGTLWEVGNGQESHFRCRTGHAFTPLSLAAGQSHLLEEALNEAFRALKEKEHLERRLGRWARDQGNTDGAVYHEQQAANAERYGAVLWEMLAKLEAVTAEKSPAPAPASADAESGEMEAP